MNELEAGAATTRQLRYLHWSSVIFDVTSQVRSLIVPAILLLLGAARGDSIWLVIGAISVVPTLIYSIIRFLTLRFQISNGQLIVKHGLIFRNVRSVPVERIQNIDFVQNPLHRLIGVAEVRIETAAGSEPEATLRVLKLEQVEQLRSEIFESRQTHSVDTLSAASPSSQALLMGVSALETDAHSTTQAAASTLLEIPAVWLFYAGLASNRGAVLIGVLMAFLYEAKAFQKIDFQKFRQLLPNNLGIVMGIGFAIAAFVVIMLLLRVLGIVWYQLRFYGYRLSRKGEDLRISCGLFTKVQATVPRRRIQFISVQRNLIMRFLGYSSVRIETASGGGDHDDATKSVSSRWFIPIVADNHLVELLSQIRPGLVWDESKFNFQPISQRAFRRASRLSCLVAIVLSALGLLYSQPWGALAGILALPLLLWVARKHVLAIRYARTDEGVVFRSGVFSIKTSMTFFEKIQSLEVQQSPFDRRWRMAKLTLDTAAAGPADHVIHIPYLDEPIAHREQETIKQLAALHRPVFG
jgi:putative membrane protein